VPQFMHSGASAAVPSCRSSNSVELCTSASTGLAARSAARACFFSAAAPRFVAALATVETPVQYLDAPELQRFWDADAQKLGAVVRRVGKLD